MPLVLVRMPTYRRPELLTRALGCLQAQSHQDWVCEIRDDCPDASARDVVENFGDRRVHYTQNRPQKFMVRNLDDCFLRDNPYAADYFFMLEDDNQVRPHFMARGIEIVEQLGVSVCQMNQVIEHTDGSGEKFVGDAGIFDGSFEERVYQPHEFRLSLLGAIGISNGSVFWSKNILNELAVRVPTIPTLEEYLRTFLMTEPIYISLERLAVWAKNEQSTSRNLGLGKNWLRRELDLKASLCALQRAVWGATPPKLRQTFLDGGVLPTTMSRRYEALTKAGIHISGHRPDLSLKRRAKRAAVRYLGHEHPSVSECVERVAAMRS